MRREHDLTVQHMAADYNKIVDQLKKAEAELEELREMFDRNCDGG